MIKPVETVNIKFNKNVREKAIKSKLQKANERSYSLRTYQRKAISQLKNAGHSILNAPTGSGKSIIITKLYRDELKSSISRKIIIAVPQTIIAKSFIENNDSLLSKDGYNNLCSTNQKENINNLIRFIEEKSSPAPSARVIICTHATLISAFERCNKNKLKNITIWIDEAHHVKDAQLKLNEEIDVYERNKLGELVRYIVKNKKLNSFIKMSTATFFRGDSREIISEELEECFTRVDIPYDEYLSHLNYLESFSYNIVLYDADYLKAIKKLKNKYGKHIVTYIPNVNSSDIVYDKLQDAQAIINIIGPSEDDWINAVDESDRKNKKEKMQNPDLNVRGIVFLGMGKEGFDWCKADTSLIIGQRNSLTEVIQIIGRLLRDSPNKKHVDVFHFIKFNFDRLNKDKFKENVNNYLKHIYYSMLLEDVFCPVKLIITKRHKNNKEKETVKNFNKLNNIFTNINERLEFEENIISSVTDLCQDQQYSKDELRKEFEKIVSNELEDREIKQWHKEIANQLWYRYSRHTLQFKGYDVSRININLIETVENPFESLLQYTSIINVSTFKNLRQIINNKNIKITPRYTEQLIFIQRCLSFKNKGQYRDPRKFTGAVELFGSKEILDKKLKEVGL